MKKVKKGQNLPVFEGLPTLATRILLCSVDCILDSSFHYILFLLPGVLLHPVVPGLLSASAPADAPVRIPRGMMAGAGHEQVGLLENGENHEAAG